MTYCMSYKKSKTLLDRVDWSIHNQFALNFRTSLQHKCNSQGSGLHFVMPHFEDRRIWIRVEQRWNFFILHSWYVASKYIYLKMIATFRLQEALLPIKLWRGRNARVQKNSKLADFQWLSVTVSIQSGTTAWLWGMCIQASASHTGLWWMRSRLTP